MIITFVGPKGGTGKTTLAVSLATEWKERGRDVRLIDADPMRSAVRWTKAGQNGSGPTLSAPTLVAERWDAQTAALFRGSLRPELAIVDTSPRNEAIRRSVLEMTDLAIIPCGTSALDVWGAQSAFDEITRINAAKQRPIRAYALINRRIARTGVAAATRNSLQAAGIPLLGSEIGQRVAFQELPALGAGVTHFAHASAAAEEVRRFTDEVDSVVRAEREAIKPLRGCSYEPRRIMSYREARELEKATVYEPVVSGCW